MMIQAADMRQNALQGWPALIHRHEPLITDECSERCSARFISVLAGMTPPPPQYSHRGLHCRVISHRTADGDLAPKQLIADKSSRHGCKHQRPSGLSAQFEYDASPRFRPSIWSDLLSSAVFLRLTDGRTVGDSCYNAAQPSRVPRTRDKQISVPVEERPRPSLPSRDQRIRLAELARSASATVDAYLPARIAPRTTPAVITGVEHHPADSAGATLVYIYQKHGGGGGVGRRAGRQVKALMTTTTQHDVSDRISNWRQDTSSVLSSIWFLLANCVPRVTDHEERRKLVTGLAPVVLI